MSDPYHCTLQDVINGDHWVKEHGVFLDCLLETACRSRIISTLKNVVYKIIKLKHTHTHNKSHHARLRERDHRNKEHFHFRKS